MIETRQDPAFAQEMLRAGGGDRFRAHHLHRYEPLEGLVRPLRQVDGSHAPASEQVHDAVGADQVPRAELTACLVADGLLDHALHRQGRRAVHQMLGPGAGVEHQLDLAAQVLVRAAALVQEGNDGVGLEFEGLVEDRRDLLPAFRAQAAHVGVGSDPSSGGAVAESCV